MFQTLKGICLTSPLNHNLSVIGMRSNPLHCGFVSHMIGSKLIPEVSMLNLFLSWKKTVLTESTEANTKDETVTVVETRPCRIFVLA